MFVTKSSPAPRPGGRERERGVRVGIVAGAGWSRAAGTSGGPTAAMWGSPVPCRRAVPGLRRARTEVAVGGHGDERGVLVLLAPGFVGPVVVAEQVEGALVKQLHAQVPCRTEEG